MVSESTDSSELERPRLRSPHCQPAGGLGQCLCLSTSASSSTKWGDYLTPLGPLPRTSGWCPARSGVRGTTSERVLPSPFIFQMGNLRPGRGKGLLKVTQLGSGQAGSPESPELHPSGTPVRVETLPGSSRSLAGGRNNPRCLVTPLKWEAWKTSIRWWNFKARRVVWAEFCVPEGARPSPPGLPSPPGSGEE